MGSRLSDAPWWMWALVYGLAFAAVRTGVAVLGAPGLRERVLIIAAGSVVAGAAVAPFMAGVNRRARRALGPLTPGSARLAVRATMRGPAPDDEQVRRAARRLAQFRRDENLRGRTPMTALFGLTVLGCLVAAAVCTPMWILAALPLLALSGYAFWLPLHLHRRIAVLSEPESPSRGTLTR
jgi:hypothetical protein